MTHDEMIAVIQAAKEGRPMLYREIGSQLWVDIAKPAFNFLECEYRIKPEPPKPREWWVNGYTGAFYGPYSSKEAADCHATRFRTECIRVREVIDEKV